VTFGISPDYTERAEAPLYTTGVVPPRWGPVWQPDVYRLATRLATQGQCPVLVDVGCGGGDKLVHAARGRKAIGLDIGSNFEESRIRWPSHEWRECDLDGVEHLPIEPGEARDAIVVCADVIEHLVNPAPLVDCLVGCLEFARFVLISTPDRELVWGRGHLGPPPNPFHVREWTSAELVSFVEERGAICGAVGLTRANDHVRSRTTILIVLAQSDDSLRQVGLVRPDAHRVGSHLLEAAPPPLTEQLYHDLGALRGAGIAFARRNRDLIKRRRQRRSPGRSGAVSS
jgi:SAM-dependent methyltransferase